MHEIRRIALFTSICVVIPVLYGQPGRITGKIDSNRTIALSGRVHPLANAKNDRGPVEASFALPGITLLLKGSSAQQADLQQYLQEQQDPASPNFEKWLTPEQYADRFGASASDLAQIQAWAQSQGLQVTNVARSRTFISFSATA